MFKLYEFFYTLHVAVAQSSSDDHVMLCTSGFVGDNTFSCNGANGAKSKTTLCLVEFARWQY